MFGTKEEVVWVAKACISYHSLCRLTSLMARVVVGHSLRCPFGEGIMSDKSDVEFRSFIFVRNMPRIILTSVWVDQSNLSH